MKKMRQRLWQTLLILPKASAQAHVRSMHLHALKLEGVDTTRVLLVVVRSIEGLIDQGRTLVDLMVRQGI